MEQLSISENLENKASDIDLHDLEALLQQGTDNAKLKVIDHRVECLLPAGENYGSLVLKIDATICKRDDTEKEDLHLVAKVKVPSSPFLELWILGMKREVFAYTELLPMYKDIERDAGVPETELIDIMPKYMGHRNSFKNNDEIDKDSIIIMENIVVKGYYSVDRHIGLDLEHAQEALKALARYHALGIAMKQKHPSFARVVITNSEDKITEEGFVEQTYYAVRKAFHKYAKLTDYVDVIETSIAYNINKWHNPQARQVGPWDSINHGDFWTNNILFHKNDEGQVDDVRFVDWSVNIHISALSDLPYFFCTSIQKFIVDNHFDDLLNVYYESFVATLERVGCDTTMFTRESFDAELRKQAINEIAFIALAIKFIRFKVDKGDETNRELYKNVFAIEGDFYEVSLMSIIEIYKARKWL